MTSTIVGVRRCTAYTVALSSSEIVAKKDVRRASRAGCSARSSRAISSRNSSRTAGCASLALAIALTTLPA
jgi:hypothetical protein